jgi:hypothetical protein
MDRYFPAGPASVSPGEVIVAAFDEFAKQRCRLLLPTELSLATFLLQLVIARRVDLSGSPGNHIVRGHITNGAVQAYGVVGST